LSLAGKQARLVQMQQNVYEAYQKSADELHAYLEANYRQFQIAGTDFAWHFYGRSQGIITVFPLDQGRRDTIVQAQQPRSRDIRGRFIRRPD
jgi:hypothetical protein